MRSSANHTDVKDVIKPYDWTYTTDYKGTLRGASAFEETDETKIDMERLKRLDPILFYDDTILYEDELADNGTAVLSIRMVSQSIRVMCGMVSSLLECIYVYM